MATLTDTPSRNAASALLTQVDAWIFDLDNTLYPASCNLFAQIDVRMRRFIAEALGIGEDDAFVLQKRYYREYGTTLRGLMLAHGIDPDRFLAYVHDIDCSVLAPDPRLGAALAGLPGRRVIYTNGSERHAENVLASLGISRHFDAIFDIRAAGYIPKPNAESYERMTRHCGIDARRSAMFEDIARNLAPAAAAGMTTIWVREDGHQGWASGPDGDLAHVHHVTRDLAGWLTGLQGGTPA